MSYISPILSSRLNNKTEAHTNKVQHQKVYDDLTQHANDVKPNEAKAKLVEETRMQAASSYVKDLKQDTKNFFTAVKTGKMNDNSLGRINDLGLKAGGLLIATFLAANAKTKTDAIMKFVGSGAFFASMSLWPKLFINLPAKIVHGFDIGQKYVSAQGDKKDFFLDNQFLPWDAYPDEKLEKIGKHNKIDINEENGKEKIQRKMQKVALQNRTLWMATAGFATPLMTALFCDKVEPHIKNGVINSQFKKAQDYVTDQDGKFTNGMKEAIDSVVTQPNTEIADFFKDNNTSDKDFFNKLAEKLSFSEIDLDKEDLQPIQKFTSTGTEAQTVDALRNIFNKTTEITVDKDTLTDVLSRHLKASSEDAGLFGGQNTNKIETIVSEFFKDGEAKTIDRLKGLLTSEGYVEEYKEIAADKDLKIDPRKFEEYITNFYSDTVLPTRSKLKLYLEKVISPIIGSKAESKSTQETTAVLQNIFKNKNLKFDKEQLAALKSSSLEESQQILQQYIQSLTNEVAYDSDNYKALINELINAQQDDSKEIVDILPKPIKGIVEKVKPETTPKDKKITNKMLDSIKGLIERIRPNTTEDNKELVNALCGEKISPDGIKQQSLFGGILPDFVQQQKTNLEGFTSRIAICANFESRLKEGKITINGVDLRAEENKDLLEAAKKIIYRGNQSLIENKANIQRPNQKEVFNDLMNALFNQEAFQNEPEVVKNTAKGLLEQTGGQTEKYLRNLDITAQIKNAATNMSNNKAWKKIFVPMALALVGVTLLVQPLFGKIDKEFPEEKGGNK